MRISDWSSVVCSSDLPVDGFIRLAMCMAHFRFTQLPIGGRNQPFEIALEDIVMRACLHGSHRPILADGAGDDDKRNIHIHAMHQRQRIEGAESRHAEIRVDDVPGFAAEFGLHVFRRFKSEEHTSELQSLMRTSYAVFCLKKKK